MAVKRVVYESTKSFKPGDDVIDGSNEYLHPDDRITDEDRKSPFYGLLRRKQEEMGMHLFGPKKRR